MNASEAERVDVLAHRRGIEIDRDAARQWLPVRVDYGPRPRLSRIESQVRS